MRTITGAIVLIWVAAVLTIAAQQPQAPAPAPAAAAPRTAGQQFKNIQVLKDVPAAILNQSMHLLSGELGVECEYCHIWEKWDRDDRPMKAIARRMMAMTIEINKSAFGGGNVVTCYTCHRGHARPVNALELPIPEPENMYTWKPAVVLPTVDQLLAKYVQALGGEQALRAVTSRVIIGKRDLATGPGGIIPVASDVEMYQKAPNLTATVYRTHNTMLADGFDGKTAWAQNAAGGVNDLPEPDQSRVRRMANFYEPLDMKKNYEQMRVAGVETINRRQAYVVVAIPPNDTPEKLYFDTQSGLLLRRAVYLNTAMGQSPFETNFDDYRSVGGGVKMPFIVHMTPASNRVELHTTSTLHVTKVQLGASIDDARFIRPQPRVKGATR